MAFVFTCQFKGNYYVHINIIVSHYCNGNYYFHINIIVSHYCNSQTVNLLEDNNVHAPVRRSFEDKSLSLGRLGAMTL